MDLVVVSGSDCRDQLNFPLFVLTHDISDMNWPVRPFTYLSGQVVSRHFPLHS